MMLTRKAATACLTAMLALPLAAGAQIGPRNQDTFFTFSQTVELPNVTLPAGTYLFQLDDSPGNRHIVRVMSQDRQKLYTTLLAVPAYSLDRPPESPQVRFMESPASGPNAVKIWFYPGNSTGHEFIYPRNQALKLAKASGDSVLTTRSESEMSATVADTDLTRVNPEGRDADANMSGQRASANARTEHGRMQAEAPSTAASSADPSQAAETRAAQAPAASSSEPAATTQTADTTPAVSGGQPTMAPSTARSAADPSQGAETRAAQTAPNSTGERTEVSRAAGALPAAAAGAAGTAGRTQTPETAGTSGDRTAAAGATGTAGPAGREAGSARRELPRTAGSLPMLALFGVTALAASRWLRRARRG